MYRLESQSDLFGAASIPKKKTSGAFIDNMKLPIHRWFRYSAGFSAMWAQQVISEFEGKPLQVLDPFAGSGTTLLASQALSVNSVGFETHPMVVRVARAKIMASSIDPAAFLETTSSVLDRAKRMEAEAFDAPELLMKCYPPETLKRLLSIRFAFIKEDIKDEALNDLVWLLITSILRECSPVGTAQWQYILPNKSKASAKDPYIAFSRKAQEFKSDMLSIGKNAISVRLLQHDSRVVCSELPAASTDLVITSPPYPNNYDYADATRLEMTFWGEISRWSELHSAVRNKLITSCSQHASAERFELEGLLADPALAPIRAELSEACRQLEIAKGEKAGKKAYDTMAAAYFRDLSLVWKTLAFHMKRGGKAFFVIGDSAPYGVYLPVDRWLGELALAAGFSGWTFDQLRERNTKWKNRKHRVLLKEGILEVTN